MAAVQESKAPRQGLGSPTSPKTNIVLLSDELERTATSHLEPYAFFVSWHGVLTLAYRGFTPALVDMKNRILAAHPALPPENPGSRWPKTTIGCLNDGASLSNDEFKALNDLCKDMSSQYFDNNSTEGTRPQIAVDAATVVIYGSRSLENLVFQHTIAFDGGKDGTEPTPEEAQRVKLIVGEAEDPNYYAAVAREGNRMSHYHNAAIGATLIHLLSIYPVRGSAPRAALRERGVRELDDRHRLIEAINEFKRAVEVVLPGRYVFFREGSLHITLRALIM